ncbi:MAG: sulfatase-like hydrolase/transferase [Clostridia bacterium]|nr:sulfatase-like hydrolase/transferase [Clostridia bacterium]
MASAILSIITCLFKDKVNAVLTSIILFIIGVMFSIQCVFYHTFKVYFSLSNLGLSDQIFSFSEDVVKLVFKNTIYIVAFMMPFIIYMLFRKKIKLQKNSLSNFIIYVLIFIFSCGLFIHRVNVSINDINGAYELYHNVNDVSISINTLGVLNSYTLEFYRLIFGFEQKIKQVFVSDISSNNIENVEKVVEYGNNELELDFKETANKEIKTINEYIMNDEPTSQNEYTGIFKDYNLIYITAESFSQIGISEELTPTLYKLTHSGFIFDNYYTPNVLSTIGGEFQSLTGLYPNSSILTKWRSGKNYFPYGLGTTFKNLGYSTYAYHNNSYTFQDRNKYMKSQGFDNFLGQYNGMEKRMNCNKWPQSDDEMIEVTVSDYIGKGEPFLAYYMTVSGHFPYTFVGNSMAIKNKEAVKELNLSEDARAYIATQIELDKALERLINALSDAGKLDNTVIVLLADHYPYKLSMQDINSLSDYTRDDVVEVNHNSLIIWNNQLEDIHVTKPCMSIDVLPTVCNLFGIEYDSRLLVGKDILSDALGIAIMYNHSWVTEEGTYYANTRKFVAKDDEVPEGYVKSISDIVDNRLNISKMIVKNDYYNYLFN